MAILTFPEKTTLHPRNKHRERYDFEQLITTSPELVPYVFLNKFNEKSIDFANSEAVKLLNKAILAHFYQIKNWDIPPNYLCPPIPGRADYVHYMADILAESNAGIIPKGKAVKCLDIGVGANCIYPIIGHQEYGWSFVGSDIDPLTVKSANSIVKFNDSLKGKIECRIQPSSKHFFENIIKPNEFFDLTFCNPPFHASSEEANAGNLRKVRNLSGQKMSKSILNFGGQNNELWCEGGEFEFIKLMINESAVFAKNCLWFSTLVSKKEHLSGIYKILERVKPIQIKTIEMAQGQKVSRIVAWSFLADEEYKHLKKNR
jgi:23S rRNA (adenine1618-N6)-methyltransferase